MSVEYVAVGYAVSVMAAAVARWVWLFDARAERWEPGLLPAHGEYALRAAVWAALWPVWAVRSYVRDWRRSGR